MAGGKLFGGSNMSLLLQNERLPCTSEVLESLWVHTPASFQGDLYLLNSSHFFLHLIAISFRSCFFTIMCIFELTVS